MNTTTVWKLVPAAPNQDWTNAFSARGPRIGTFDTTIRDVLATAPAPAFDLQDALQGVRAGLAFLPPGDAAIAGLDRIIAIFGAAPGGAEDDTPARTGNTAKEQDMFAAGLEVGESDAKNNAAIRAAASASAVAPGDAQDERQEWMTCESRRPWVTNSLKASAEKLRNKERRCRRAYTQDFYGVPARYVADVYAEAAAVFEAKLAALAAQVPHKGGEA